MASGFQFVTSRDPAILAMAAIHTCLVAVIALTAVFTTRPARRNAALDVLELLLPGISQARLQEAVATTTARRQSAHAELDDVDINPAASRRGASRATAHQLHHLLLRHAVPFAERDDVRGIHGVRQRL